MLAVPGLGRNQRVTLRRDGRNVEVIRQHYWFKFYIFSHCWCQGWGWGWLQPRNKGPGVRKAVCAGGEGGRHHAEETNSWMHTQVSKTETLNFWIIGMSIMSDSWGTKSRQWGFIINTSSPCTNYNIIKWQWIMHGDILMLFVSENHGLGSNILATWMNLKRFREKVVSGQCVKKQAEGRVVHISPMRIQCSPRQSPNSQFCQFTSEKSR